MKYWLAVKQSFKRFWLRSLLLSITMVLVFYSLQMLALIVRFGDLPNYLNTYDWLGNVVRIFESTPSLRDSLIIAKDEWLLEIGYLNTDFGLGISEWSLFIMPWKVLQLLSIFFLLCLNFLVLQSVRRNRCATSARTRNMYLANGLAASMASITSITMSWVVCCSTPTWVVGLAMLGLGVTTSLQLEIIGPWIFGFGCILLLAITVYQMRHFAHSEITLNKI